MKEYKYKIDGKEYNVTIGNIVENIADLTVNGEDFKVEMEQEKVEVKEKPVLGKAQNSTIESDVAPTNVNTSNAIKAPLPGVITEIKVNVGDEVAVGDTLVVLEAMKMANNIEAEAAGKVTAILIKQGESVMEDTPLVIVE